MIDKETRELLPDLIKETMDALTENTNAPDEMTLPITLAVASFATQGIADGHPMRWESCPINNFFVVLTPSGGLKTKLSDSLLEGAKRFEESQRKVAQDAWTDYLVATKKYNNEVNDRAKKKGDPILLPGQVLDKIETPQYPRTARYMASKFTLNGLLNTLRGVPHMGMFNSDAAEFFNSYSFKDANTSVEIVSAMSRLWSGEDVDKITGVEDIYTRGKRTTALFMLQQELAGFFVNPQFKDQGFTNRMLITQCELTPRKKADFSKSGLSSILTNDSKLIPFNDRVYDLLASVDDRQNKPSGKGLVDIRRAILKKQNDDKTDPNVLVLPTIGFCHTDGSHKVMEDFCNEMDEAALDPKYKEYQNFFVRAYEHCVRLAIVLTIFDGKDEATVREAKCSVGLMRFFIDQRMNLNIDGSVKIDPIVECAKKVVNWMNKQDSNIKITKTVLNNNGPKAYREMKGDQREQVLKELRERNWVECVEDTPLYMIVKQNAEGISKEKS